MDQTINERRRDLRTDLVASATMREDGMAIYSEEGEAPIHDQVLPIELIKIQLESSGALPENAVRFVDDLKAHGVAEIRQPRLPITSVTLS